MDELLQFTLPESKSVFWDTGYTHVIWQNVEAELEGKS